MSRVYPHPRLAGAKIANVTHDAFCVWVCCIPFFIWSLCRRVWWRICMFQSTLSTVSASPANIRISLKLHLRLLLVSPRIDSSALRAVCSLPLSGRVVWNFQQRGKMLFAMDGTLQAGEKAQISSWKESSSQEIPSDLKPRTHGPTASLALQLTPKTFLREVTPDNYRLCSHMMTYRQWCRLYLNNFRQGN